MDTIFIIIIIILHTISITRLLTNVGINAGYSLLASESLNTVRCTNGSRNITIGLKTVNAMLSLNSNSNDSNK